LFRFHNEFALLLWYTPQPAAEGRHVETVVQPRSKERPHTVFVVRL
jgi:hypothetical protein